MFGVPDAMAWFNPSRTVTALASKSKTVVMSIASTATCMSFTALKSSASRSSASGEISPNETYYKEKMNAGRQ